MIELTVGLGLSVLVLVAGYRLLTSQQRNMTDNLRLSSSTSDHRQMQKRLIADLREALPVRSTNCVGSPQPVGCAGVVVSSITPLSHDQTLDGFPSPKMDAIRVVLPKAGRSVMTPINLAKAMANKTDSVQVLDADAVDLPKGSFALIDDGNTSDLFLITDVTDGDPGMKRLSHDPSTPWNYSGGLSEAFTKFATIRSVNVVSIGVVKTPAGNQLIWKDASRADPVVLATGIESFEIAYHVFGATMDLPGPCAGLSPGTPCVDDFQGIQRVVFSFDYEQGAQATKLVLRPSPDRISVAFVNL